MFNVWAVLGFVWDWFIAPTILFSIGYYARPRIEAALDWMDAEYPETARRKKK
jgi:hypothetical protein